MTDAHPIRIRAATAEDAASLARVAAITFPLACPPQTNDAAKAAFIAANLTERHFAGYLADPSRSLLLGLVDGEAAGYAMLVAGEPGDPDVTAVVNARPAVELSKFYVMPAHHGAGVANALMQATIDAARVRGTAVLWLGVNQENARANRFYERHGFASVGTKRFLVGDCYEHDFVRALAL